MSERTSNLMLAAARLPGRRFPVKGWSVVTEHLHPLIANPASEVTHQTPWGVTMRLDLTDYVQRCIYYDAFEVEELDFMRGLLRPGDVVVDAGAHVGYFTLVAARAVGADGQVHAFEPVPGNHERLTENIELNSLTNVRLNRAALGDGDGTITLGIDHDMERSSGRRTSGHYAAGLGLRQVSAPVVRLDDYLSEAVAGRSVRVLKMDIEGSEPRALAGMEATLAGHRIDVLLMEVSVYNLARQGLAIRDMIAPLERARYRLYRLASLGVLRRWRYRGEPSIPRRGDEPVGFLRNIADGVQDQRGRQFNLVAVRSDHPAVRTDPRLLRASALAGG
jgi:FkbM family methyltransferase